MHHNKLTPRKRGPKVNPDFAQWKDIHLENGYWFVYNPSHPRANSHGRVKRCILIMEKYAGMIFPKSLQVHHINGDRGDDRIENLSLVTIYAHNSIHKKGNIVQKAKT